MPDADLAADPPGGVAAVEDLVDGVGQVSWWTGSETVALNGTDLAPVWTLTGTLGPAVAYGGNLLVPVPAGLAEVDPLRGTVMRTLPVERVDRTAPVRLATDGEVLLEQRGADVVALVPSP